MVSKRGEYIVTNGGQMQLMGFKCSAGASLKSSLFMRCPVTIDRVTGQAFIKPRSLPEKQNPQLSLRASCFVGTTRFELATPSTPFKAQTILELM
jgi:hypothetical protein